MKTISSILILAAAVLVIASCNKEKLDRTTIDNANIKKDSETALKFADKELVKTYNNCKAGEENCTYIRLKYIEATSGTIKDKVNKLIGEELLYAYQMPDSHFKTPDEMMAAFMRDYETFRKEVPSAPQVWSTDLVVKVYAETEKVLCIRGEFSAYLGGAHPNSSTGYFNINKQTGDTVSLASLLKPGFEAPLNKLIDKKYREMKNLKPADNLAEKGDLFDNKIEFNYCFAVTKDKGLEFVYNPYEIAPYAVGPITVKLSRAELEDIAAPDGLLK
jgi:hypothetical protein